MVQLLKGHNGEGYVILPLIKKNFGYKKYKDIISKLKKCVSYRDYFLLELYPNNINNIITIDNIPLSCSLENFSEKELINELNCSMAFLSNFNNELSKFEELRFNFERNLFSGEYIVADKFLEEIKENFGFSFWYIESKMVLSSYSMKLKESDKLYQDIKLSCEDLYIKNFIRTLRRKTNIFERYSDSYTFIIKKMNDIYYSHNIEEYKARFFEYYFINNRINTISLSSAYYLLMMASKLNLIDMFLIIDRIIVQIMGSESIESKDSLISVTNELNIPFSFKKSVQLLNGTLDNNDEITLAICNLKKYLCNEKFLLEELNNIVSLFPNTFDIILNLTKIGILNNYEFKFKGELLNSIIQIINYFTIKNGNYRLYSEISDKADRLLFLLNSTTLNFQYLNFYSDSFESNKSWRFSNAFTSRYYNRYIFYFFSNNEMKITYDNVFGCYESDWYHEPIYSKKYTYDHVTKKLVELESMSNYDKIKNYSYHDHDSHMKIIVKNRLFEKLFYYYIEVNNIEEAIDLYVNLFFLSKFKVSVFNTKILDEKCRRAILRDLYFSFNFCIYAHITNFRGEKGFRFNSFVAKSVLKILKSKKLMFPSQIETNGLKTIQKQKIIYFFRHICEKELLISILTAYSVKDADAKVRTETILLERVKILKIALELEMDEYEKEEIKYQLREAKDDISYLKKSELENTLVSSAKIFEESIFISDTDIIFPFFENIDRIRLNSNSDKSEEYSLFKDSVVKYKKAFIKSLDDQIGINIRHGFLRDKIINYFYKEKYAFKTVSKNLKLDKLNEFEANENTLHIIPYVDMIINFSKRLYMLVDKLVDEIRIVHTSNSSDTNVFHIFISDEYITEIITSIYEISNSYELKRLLHEKFVSILDLKLNKIGEYVENRINNECIDLIKEIYIIDPIKAPKVAKEITLLISGVPELSKQINEWFRFIRWGKELCLIDKYFLELKNKYPYLTYNISEDFPKQIQLTHLHYINLILSNLIMNAEEHSGLSRELLKINIDLNLSDYKYIKIQFKNNLSETFDENEIRNKIEELERNLKICEEGKYEKKKGNGFYHIKRELNLHVGSNWNVEFCKEDLPKYFRLFFIIGMEEKFD